MGKTIGKRAERQLRETYRRVHHSRLGSGGQISHKVTQGIAAYIIKCTVSAPALSGATLGQGEGVVLRMASDGTTTDGKTVDFYNFCSEAVSVDDVVYCVQDLVSGKLIAYG